MSVFKSCCENRRWMHLPQVCALYPCFISSVLDPGFCYKVLVMLDVILTELWSWCGSKFRQRGSLCCLIRSCSALYTAPVPYIKHPGPFSLKILLLTDNSLMSDNLSCLIVGVKLAIERDFVIKYKRWIIHIVWSGKSEIVAILNTSDRRKCVPFQEYNMNWETEISTDILFVQLLYSLSILHILHPLVKVHLEKEINPASFCWNG